MRLHFPRRHFVLICLITGMVGFVSALTWSVRYSLFSDSYLNDPVFRETLRRIADHREIFLREANAYQVDPVALAGVVLAEAVLNRKAVNWLEDVVLRSVIPTLSDKEMDALLEYSESCSKASPIVSRLQSPLNWTVGVSQIQSRLAVRLEQDDAMQKGQRPLDQRATIRKLLTPKGSIHYAAVYMDFLANDYESRFAWSVRYDPGILATLYNVGVRPANHRVSRLTGPRTNAFGRFVEDHSKRIADALSGNDHSSFHSANGRAAQR